MSEEIIVKYNMRAPLIAGCVFVCLISGAMIVFGWGTLDHPGPRDNPEAFIGFGAFGVVWAVWKIRALASGKPYLETSEDGIFVGAGLHCYIPWENVEDISIRRDEDKGDVCAIRFEGFGQRLFRQVVPPAASQILHQRIAGGPHAGAAHVMVL